MARRGHARGEPPAARPLRGPRLGGRAPRPPSGRGVGRTAARPPRDVPARGLFFTIEGLDFSGKTTLVRALKDSLAGTGTHFTREPGGTPVAERIRDIVLDPEAEMDAWTEAYLYAAARADHARGEVLPRLERGEDVVCERYLDSSLAYQGFGRGLGLEAVRGLNAYAVGAVIPDKTFYLRLRSGERERRARELGAALDRIEVVGADFMRRVEEGFEELARQEPERIVVLDASRSPGEMAEKIVGEMRQLQYTRDQEAT
ncbi:dTMP kinase [Rubrobacter tropicus]|uniref:dTMP kinase n=1 Tax=Rubrobacter tropicus TaxID=2653851 RepID=UPI0014072A26|nr:dTMP kinase [Rubrobacter tropicus]